jgi:hypothetical protein
VFSLSIVWLQSNNTQREHIKLKMSDMNPIKQYSTRTHKTKNHLYLYVFTLSIVWLGSCRLSLCVLVEYCLIGFMSLIFSFMCSHWVLFDWVHVNTQREHIQIKMSDMNPIKQYSTRTHKDKDEQHEPNQTILNENT